MNSEIYVYESSLFILKYY